MKDDNTEGRDAAQCINDGESTLDFQGDDTLGCDRPADIVLN
jgi:hypothetical protein